MGGEVGYVRNRRLLLTVHIGVQPEDAGVRESERPPQPVPPLLLPLLLQPATVRDARLFLDLKTPAGRKTDSQRFKYRAAITRGPANVPPTLRG